MRWFLGICTALGVLAAVHAQAAVTNPDAVAVIIGNRAYTGRDVPEVKYADRDAQAMKRYVIDVLGYDEKNIIYVENAAQSQLLALFGTENEPGKVSRWLRRDGTSDLFVYYSGHGVPGLKDGQSYLLPVDGDPSAGQLNGYPLKLLYANLEKTSAKTITVLLDACFAGQTGNGASLIRNASVLVRPADPAPASAMPRMTVLTASGADEVANWDDTDRHGLFTEYFLRGVYGAADSPKYGGKGDGHVTVATMRNYLSREMSYFAGREIGRDQNATISGDDTEVLAAFQPGRPLVRPDAASKPAPVVPAVMTAPTPPSVTPPAPPPAAQGSSSDALVREALSLKQQKQYDRSLALLRQAAEAGNAGAMALIGDAYQAGLGVPQDKSQALYWYRRGADLGHPGAINMVGIEIDHGVGSVPPDPAEALKWFRRSAELGDAGGINNLGYAYMTGRGVEKNVTEALRLYRQSADLGNSVAMFNLADAYANGNGVPRDDATAFGWYRKAADLGNGAAIFRVGFAYENGKGVAEDWPQSVVWYRKGADLGNPDAMSNLGYALEYGRGVAKNDADAAGWYRRAAEMGDIQANYELGQMYRNGRVGPVDLTTAAKFLRRAADAGNGPAKTALGEIQLAMAPAAPSYQGLDPSAAEQALSLTPANRVALQQGLTMLNYPTGGTDGQFGPMTRQAILGYQRHLGVAATGYFTRETVDRLVAEIKARQASMTAPAPPTVPQGTNYAGGGGAFGYANERMDYGVQPQTWLQTNVGSPTPTSIPGGAHVLSTQDLIRALTTPSQSPFMVIDVLDGAPHPSVRGALRMPLAGHSGSFNDITQQTVAAQLNQATGGRKDTPLVFLCRGSLCWESYNAALRAMQAGYQHVYWYRGGLDAWIAAGQPVV
jgi:PQQ-dependent catabolism-associated CXXCW motif protein